MMEEQCELVPVVAMGNQAEICVACGRFYRHTGLVLELRLHQKDGCCEVLGSVCPSCLSRGVTGVKAAAKARAEHMQRAVAAFEQVERWPDGCYNPAEDDGVPF